MKNKPTPAKKPPVILGHVLLLNYAHAASTDRSTLVENLHKRARLAATDEEITAGTGAAITRYQSEVICPPVLLLDVIEDAYAVTVLVNSNHVGRVIANGRRAKSPNSAEAIAAAIKFGLGLAIPCRTISREDLYAATGSSIPLAIGADLPCAAEKVAGWIADHSVELSPTVTPKPSAGILRKQPVRAIKRRR